mgnify:CR=1 FL=1
MKKSMVSSLSASFKKVALTEDREEAKLQHRNNLHTLVQKYMEDVESGKATGIKNAKELVDVMKMDLLLMGEVTERSETNTVEEEVRINKLTQFIDANDENISKILSGMMDTLNEANDKLDSSYVKKEYTEEDETVDINDDALDEIAKQAMNQMMEDNDNSSE